MGGRFTSTIADVAKRAGVSAMTVSRVINKNYHVSEETRAKVEKAIAELSYRPNMVARGLVTNRTKMIAYVVSNLANPFFPNVISGINRTCARYGYLCTIFDVRNKEQFQNCLDVISERRLDGAIFHHLNLEQKHADMLHSNGVAVVTIDNECDLKDVSSVDTDNYGEARRATRLLIENGHKAIGCLHGLYEGELFPETENVEYAETFQRRIWKERTRGFLDEMRDAGLEPACMFYGRGSTSYRSMTETEEMRHLFDHKVDFTALYCENDLFALCALGNALENKVRIPEELAIIGHDGIEMAMTLYPRVTTMNKPKTELGIAATEQIISMMNGDTQVHRMRLEASVFFGDTVFSPTFT